MANLLFVTALRPGFVILTMMKPDATPSVHSFIVRFVVEDAPEGEAVQPVYHGAIRHIQSAEELNFNGWREVVVFMQRFVLIEDLNEKSGPLK